MEENKNISMTATSAEAEQAAAPTPDDEPLDKNVRLMSPTRMVVRMIPTRASGPSWKPALLATT